MPKVRHSRAARICLLRMGGSWLEALTACPRMNQHDGIANEYLFSGFELNVPNI